MAFNEVTGMEESTIGLCMAELILHEYLVIMKCVAHQSLLSASHPLKLMWSLHLHMEDGFQSLVPMSRKVTY